MKKLLLRIVCILFAILCWAGHASAWDGVVVRVLDGDSLKVQRDGRIVEVRLYGIDTPEYKQPYSNKAKQFTKRLTHDQKVSIREKDVDRYGRIVALLVSREKLVNRELVREGLAWYYPRYCKEQPLCSELEALEKKARKQRKGLWRDNNPVSPWEWKYSKKKTGSKKGFGRYFSFLDWW